MILAVWAREAFSIAAEVSHSADTFCSKMIVSLYYVIQEMHSFSMRPAKYFYDKPLTKYLDSKTVLIYRPHPVYFTFKRIKGGFGSRFGTIIPGKNFLTKIYRYRVLVNLELNQLRKKGCESSQVTLSYVSGETVGILKLLSSPGNDS